MCFVINIYDLDKFKQWNESWDPDYDNDDPLKIIKNSTHTQKIFNWLKKLKKMKKPKHCQMKKKTIFIISILCNN